ncbi:L-seryl-tRNA(Sec) selenium transferase [Peribacillus sp. SCS-155]|uniref:L-seryl-tRNA(Sec) selenium transferase n=1 Tax=Peribacillus sedimenti TaxID=3115297 RepID=UPI00390631EB
MEQHLLRLIPPVHELQRHARFKKLMEVSGLDEKSLTAAVKEQLDEVRKLIQSQTWSQAMPGTDAFILSLFDLLDNKLARKYEYQLKSVINATGTVLHTNLGRAKLSESAIKHVVEISANYSNLEYNIHEGNRGSRHSHVEQWITEITGAEAAMVVNNNAAAVFLVLRALAKNKEVIVSRGELVEIGGSFRISTIMEESGASLIEVGTTNKTHVFDYRGAITSETAIIMKVHTSNFKVIGFTESVKNHELIALAGKHEHILFYEDLGSGVLHDFSIHGIGEEPVVRDVISAGADLVTFSGDKLLGGPQAGIIAGKKVLIDILKKHQLARVLRVDKMTLAALEATLVEYLKGDASQRQIPAVRDILLIAEELQVRAAYFLKVIKEKNIHVNAQMIEDTSTIGGGTMPGIEIPTVCIAIKHEKMSANELSEKLRLSSRPIIARIKQDNLLFDMRTINDEEVGEIVSVLGNIMK